MNQTDWVMVAAVVLGPILAVQIERYLGRRRAKKQRKLDVFRQLMANRAAGLAPIHVDALNRIDVEFYGDKKVTETWKAYLDHLNDRSLTPETWGSKTPEVLADLLYEMAQSVGYDFDKVHIKRAAYYPQGFGDIEQDQTAIRKGVAAIMKGDAALPMAITTIRVSDEEGAEQSELRKLMIQAYKGEARLSVGIENSSSSEESI